jgi:hypothetical protein
VPTHRKELYFFTKNFANGAGWYSQFFPSASETQGITAIGEISPDYLYDIEALQRIHAFGVRRIIAMLRNPVNRTYSEYNHFRRFQALPPLSEEIRDPQSMIVRHSLYSEGIAHSIELFGRAGVLVLLYEDIQADATAALTEVARFLGLDAMGFPKERSEDRVNQGFVPRFTAATHALYAFDHFLRRRGLDAVVEKAKAICGRRVLSVLGTRPEPLPQADRAYLGEYFRADIDRLEKILGRSLEKWRGGHEAEHKKIAAEMIALDLARLRRQAEANGLVLLAYLLEMAQAEADEMKR